MLRTLSHSYSKNLLISSRNIFNNFSSQKRHQNLSKQQFSKSSQKRFNLKQQYSKVYTICRPQLPKYILNSFLTLIHAGIFMYLPNIYADLNNLMQLKVSTVSTNQIYYAYLQMTAKWATLFSFMGVITYKRRYEFLDISNRISVRLRNVMFKQILQRDFYKQNQIPQTFVHQLITDIKTVSQFTGQATFMGLRGLFFLTGGISCLLYTSPHLSLIAVAIMTLFNLKFRGRNQNLKTLKEKENSVLANLSQFSSERFHNMKLIKISNTEVLEQFKFVNQLKKFYDYSKKVAQANGINYGSLQGFGLFSLFSVAVAGSFLISMEATNFSLIASSTYALYVAMGFRSVIFFNTELMKILGVYANIQKKIGDLTKNPQYSQPYILQRLSQQQKKIQQLFQQQIRSQQQKGLSISVKNLTFTHLYEDQHHKLKTHLYKDFNLQIKKGEIIALVGQSGTGKSTLFNLITKLVQPQTGQILINNQQIDKFSFQDMQKMVSYVTQQVFLFGGTFEQNLRYGNHGFDLTQQNLIKCLKMVNAYDFVTQKGGLKGRVDEKGNNLSGGQKQRIILARALVKHPRLLLLDQASSGIDSQSEKHIISNLQKFKAKMTVIIITHKLDPFKRIVDKIIELKKND